MIGLNVLTHSRIQCFKSCAKRHWVMYELGIRKIVSDAPLRMGAAVHDALDVYAQPLVYPEHHEKADQPMTDVDRARAACDAIRCNYSEMPNGCIEREWLAECEICLRLFTGYVWRYGNVTDIEVIACEQAFNLPLINPETGYASRSFTFAGKMDKQVNWAGRLAIEEHKTTGDSIEGDSPYWGKLRVDSQISGYMVGSHDTGFAAETVLYDVIHKPGMRPLEKVACVDENGDKIVVWEGGMGERAYKVGGAPYQSTGKGRVFQYRQETIDEYGERLIADIVERPDFYYARREIPRLQADLDEFRGELWMYQKMISFCRNGGHWPRNTDSCVHPYPCAIRDYCWDGFDFENETPPGFERVENVHPELGDDYDNNTTTENTTAAATEE